MWRAFSTTARSLPGLLVALTFTDKARKSAAAMISTPTHVDPCGRSASRFKIILIGKRKRIQPAERLLQDG